MAFCSKCGKEINDEAVVCVHCGCAIEGKKTSAKQDSDSFGWACLGFCIPVVGLILWLMWKDETPMKAKRAGIGALVSVILAVVFYIIYFVIILAMIGANTSLYY